VQAVFKYPAKSGLKNKCLNLDARAIKPKRSMARSSLREVAGRFGRSILAGAWNRSNHAAGPRRRRSRSKLKRILTFSGPPASQVFGLLGQNGGKGIEQGPSPASAGRLMLKLFSRPLRGRIGISTPARRQKARSLLKRNCLSRLIYYTIEIVFQDKTSLSFDLEPCVRVFPELINGKTGNYKPLRRWRPVHSRSSRI
jgi:hypothetical protein